MTRRIVPMLLALLPLAAMPAADAAPRFKPIVFEAPYDRSSNYGKCWDTGVWIGERNCTVTANVDEGGGRLFYDTEVTSPQNGELPSQREDRADIFQTLESTGRLHHSVSRLDVTVTIEVDSARSIFDGAHSTIPGAEDDTLARTVLTAGLLFGECCGGGTSESVFVTDSRTVTNASGTIVTISFSVAQWDGSLIPRGDISVRLRLTGVARLAHGASGTIGSTFDGRLTSIVVTPVA